MEAWQITPRDGLILSDGRPFQTGLAAPRSLPIPHPQTVAGLITTQRGRSADGRFELGEREARALRKEVKVIGPLLTEQSSEGPLLLAPAPLDCVWSQGEEGSSQASAHRLTPVSSIERGSVPMTSLGAYHLATPRPELGRGKPLSGPSYWRWETLMSWLAGESLAPAPIQSRSVVDEARFVSALPTTTRFHVSLERGLRSAKDGHLFVTNHVNYQQLSRGEGGTRRPVQRALTMWVEAHERALEEGVVHLGGETRLSSLTRSTAQRPSLPETVASSIQAQTGSLERVVRVTLLTPAAFELGSTPSWLLHAGPEQRHELLAWVTGRPQAASGWDLASKGPKPHRRLAPAGSSYWLRLAEGTDPVEWARAHFMSAISDKASDRNTGYGLCVTGGA